MLGLPRLPPTGHNARDYPRMSRSTRATQAKSIHQAEHIFGRDLMGPALRDRYRARVGDLVVGYLTGQDAAGQPQ